MAQIEESKSNDAPTKREQMILKYIQTVASSNEEEFTKFNKRLNKLKDDIQTVTDSITEAQKENLEYRNNMKSFINSLTEAINNNEQLPEIEEYITSRNITPPIPENSNANDEISDANKSKSEDDAKEDSNWDKMTISTFTTDEREREREKKEDKDTKESDKDKKGTDK